MGLRLAELTFGSLLAYSTKGDSPAIRHSRGLMVALKQDQMLQKPPVLMSEWVAQQVHQDRGSLPFSSFFESNPILVPTPSSSLMRAGTLWVPERLARALVRRGLGREVVPCLVRSEAVPKSATSPPSARTTALRHYETLAVQGRLSQANEILLVDDVVTRGATLLGAANRLADSFPEARIRAFGAMRAVGNPEEFQREYDPRVGIITLNEYDGQTFRRP